MKAEFGKTQSLLLGPGFGLASSTKDFLERLVRDIDPQASKGAQLEFPPSVIDADGLKLLTQLDGWREALPSGSVLTPHPGEMSQMTGTSKKEIQSDRVATAQEWAGRWGHVVVLKGAFTVVASPMGETAVIPIATPALARAGTGDVLAGAIAGLIAQGVSTYEASILGAYLHARAGLHAEKRLRTSASVLAGDVATALPLAMQELWRTG